MNRVHLSVALATTALIAAALAPRLLAHAAADDTPVVAATQAEEPAQQTSTAPPPVPEPEPQAALVEVVFVIDTTGSMGGLIEGAKETVWSIVDDFVSQTPQPDVRVGIVAYRDRGDAYVTRDLALTDDLDEVYGFLRALQASGGGDHAESVGKGLWVATDSMQWTQDRDKTFRTIFLVGDASPKSYPDEASPERIVKIARERGIYVNAVQCGSSTGTAAVFAKLATLGSGEFAAVAANGGVKRMESPMDSELADLEAELAKTALPYGAKGAAFAKKVEDNKSASLSARASRRSVLSKLGSGVATGEGDLITEVAAGRARVADVANEDLPAEWRDMSAREREADAAARIARRAEVQNLVESVTAQRDAWVAQEREARSARGDISFDAEVSEATVGSLRALGYVE